MITFLAKFLGFESYKCFNCLNYYYDKPNNNIKFCKYCKMYLKTKYGDNFIEPLNCCHYCGFQLISDKLSKKYGDYCPNLNCGYIK